MSRTGLAKTSVWAGLTSLEDTGVVSVSGTGRARLYNLRADHPLQSALGALFEAEERRFEAVLDAIKAAAGRCGPAVLAVWLYGSVARGKDRPGSDLDIAVLATDDTTATVSDAMRESLQQVGSALGFTPSVVSICKQDATRLATERDPWWAEIVRHGIIVLGPRPDEVAGPPRTGHRARVPA